MNRYEQYGSSELASLPPTPYAGWLRRTGKYKKTIARPALLLCTVIASILLTVLFLLSLMTGAGLSDAAVPKQKPTRPSSAVPDYFQTTPEAYPGPTKTAAIAPFLAQTNSAPLGTFSYAPNAPLETSYPIQGNTDNANIFQLHGQLSSYFPNPVGFGVHEWPLPPGSNITHAHLLSRHGSRYPTGDSSVSTFGTKIKNITSNGTASWTGALSFLNTWSYTLGAEILVARGRQELFDSGVLFYYNYGHLYNTSTKILSRTTSQDRMLKSAEYFMAGFFGLEWTHNVTLEPIWEQAGFNNSLAGYFQCNNSHNFRSAAGSNASLVWENIYLKNATDRLTKLSSKYNWTIADAYNAQTLCPYETVAYGYSNWCNLFTYQEWQGFEYSIDLQFQGNDGFLSPTGRGVGIGYVEELYARLRGQLYNLPPGATNVNRTLDTMNSTFPLNQNLYMDFSHDTNIYSILTALGLKQFSDKLSNSTITPNRNVTISHLTPFGARVVWEQITAPRPIKATRPTVATNAMASFYDTGDKTSYIHMTISQRTVPLGESYPECGKRDDGWCEQGTFMKVLDGLLETARYEYSCFGDYPAASWGNVTDGVPESKRSVGNESLYMLGRGMGSGLERSRNSELFH